MKQGALVFLLGLGVAIVLGLAAFRWKDIAVEIRIRRLARNPAVCEGWLKESEDTLKGMAAREFLRKRPAEVVRLLVKQIRTTVSVWEAIGKRFPDGVKDFSAEDRAEFAIDLIDGEVDGYYCRFFRGDRVEASSIGLASPHSISGPLQAYPGALFDLLGEARGETGAYEGMPAWTFTVFYSSSAAHEQAGVRFERK